MATQLARRTWLVRRWGGARGRLRGAESGGDLVANHLPQVLLRRLGLGLLLGNVVTHFQQSKVDQLAPRS